MGLADDSSLEAERRAIFERGWVCVGRVEDVAERGSWLRAPLTRSGVLVSRGRDDVLRAFHAVCPHRGSTIPTRDELCIDRITCPYHGFAFDLEGRAIEHPAGDLAAVRVATSHGFVFVTIDRETPPLEEALGEIPPWLTRARLGDVALRRARRVAYDVGASWKLVVQNFQESLHFPHVHPELEKLTPSKDAETWLPEARGSAPPGPWLGGIMPIAPDAETVSMTGRTNGRELLVPAEDARVVRDAMCFPNLLTSLQPDYLLTFVLWPVAPDRTRVIACTYVATASPPDADADVLDFWSRVYDEDRVACERQQVGLSSAPTTARYTGVEEGALAFDALVTQALTPAPAPAPAPPRAPAPAPASPSRFCGIWSRPYVDLSPFIDTSSFADLDREITLGLSKVDLEYTGGTLKWMGVTAPWVTNEPGYLDAMHAIRAMPPDDFMVFLSLGESDPSQFDPDPARRGEHTFGDETDHPFTRAQTLFLKHRFGVYFPWKGCYHLLSNDRWEDKHSGDGKDFSEEARRVFPKTVAFIESLPMIEMGRVVLFGLEAHDHAPLHRDSEPGKSLTIAQSISFEPAAAREQSAGRTKNKRFFLATTDGAREEIVDAPIYWFNDMDWHGVKADPWFRYSIRCDGVFEPKFLDAVRRQLHRH